MSLLCWSGTLSNLHMESDHTCLKEPESSFFSPALHLAFCMSALRRDKVVLLTHPPPCRSVHVRSHLLLSKRLSNECGSHFFTGLDELILAVLILMMKVDLWVGALQLYGPAAENKAAPKHHRSMTIAKSEVIAAPRSPPQAPLQHDNSN